MDWLHKFEVDQYDDDFEEHKLDKLINGTIFLIDCKKSIFDQQTFLDNEDNKSSCWFDTIVQSCLSFTKTKAMTADKDSVSIIFYRVKNQKNDIMDHVYVYQNLTVPEIGDIQKIMELQTMSSEAFDELYGFSEKCSLWHAFWCCQDQFAKNKSKLDTKQIILFTSDDNPCTDNDFDKKNLIVKMKDLRESNIHLEIIPIGDQDSFNVNKFYQMMIDFSSSSGDKISTHVSISNPLSKFKELDCRIRHKQYKKRAITHVPWFLGSDALSIDVDVYSLVRKSQSLPYCQLDRRSNMVVDKKREMFLKNSGQLLMPFDMKAGIKIDSKMISFEKEEVTKLRSIFEPGIRLLGFKPLKYLKSYYQTRAAQFIYPNESSVEGGIKIFAALLKRCLERELFAISVYVPRKSSHLQLVALVPQEEKLNESKIQIQPPGFSVIFLPFKDDIRDLDLPLSEDVSDKDKAMNEELIKSLWVEYEPETILNPAFQKQLAVLEALALNLEKPDKTEDHTVMECEAVNEHCGSILTKYKEHFNLDFTSSAAKSAKKPKIEVDLKYYHLNNKLESLTVPQLKDAASDLQIKIKGSRKADVIKSIKLHFESIE